MNDTAKRIRSEVLRLYGSGRELPIRGMDLIARFGGWFPDLAEAIRPEADAGLIEVVRWFNPDDLFGRVFGKDAHGRLAYLGGGAYIFDPNFDTPGQARAGLDLLWFVGGPDFTIRPTLVPVEV